MRGLDPSGGLGYCMRCARSITTGLGKLSPPSSLGFRFKTNSVGLPFSSPSGMPTFLISLRLDLPSRSESLARSLLFSCHNSWSEAWLWAVDSLSMSSRWAEKMFLKLCSNLLNCSWKDCKSLTIYLFPLQQVV